MRRPKLVIFDCDGVLADSEIIGHRVGVAEVARLGVPMTVEESIETFTGISDAETRRRLEEKCNTVLSDDFLQQMEDKMIARFADALESIKDIDLVMQYLDEKKMQRCVASNSMPDRLRTVLSLTGLQKYFKDEHVYGVNVVKNAKPAPDIFLYASDKMQVKPADCLVIEDSPTGIMAAKAADMPVVGFLGATHAQGDWYRDQVYAMQPQQVVHDAQALLKVLQDLF